MEKSISSGIETGNFEKISSMVNGSPQKKGPQQANENSESLVLKVKPEHRLNHEEAIKLLKRLMVTEGKIKNPEKFIKAVQEKI